MDFLKNLLILSYLLILTGCQFGYILQSANGQLSILLARESIEKVLQDPKVSESEKAKIRTVQKVREFAIQKIGLIKNKNYTQYVHLNRDYVTYVVSAAEKKKLKPFEWNYPIVGKMPYKGFFNEPAAKEEEIQLKNEGYDTYLRGVSAYSTLGWFQDPLLSSMTRYREDILVNTIIHETVHLTLYIKNSADFNERLAVFIANQATEDYYHEVEGPDSPTVKKIRIENEDEKLFSEFISREIRDLESWYQEKERSEEERQERFRLIQTHFREQIKPRLKSNTYSYFQDIPLNNARILVYKTYVSDLNDFEKKFERFGRDYRKLIAECKKLENTKNPELEFKKLL